MPTVHTSTVAGCHFVPGTKTLITASYDGTVAVWSYPEVKKTALLKTGVAIIGTDLDPTNTRLVFAGFDVDLHVYDIEKGDVRSININDVRLSRVCFLKKDVVVGGFTTGKLMFIDTGTRETRIKTGHEQAIRAVVGSPDRKRFATSAKGGEIRIWDATSFGIARVLAGKGEGCAVAFSPTANLLASGEGDSQIAIWDIERKIIVKKLAGHRDLITSIRFSRDGRDIYSASHDKTVRKWSLDTGKGQTVLTFEEEICSFCVDEDETWLAVGGLEGKTGLFKLK